MRTLSFDPEQQAVVLIDQTRLPQESVWDVCRNVEDVAEAIRSMQDPGAPAIGVAAAYGMALAARDRAGDEPAHFLEQLEDAAALLQATRPTAVNLGWALARCLSQARSGITTGDASTAARGLLALAERMADEDVETNRRMGANGRDLLPSGTRVLTHCNTGALATVDYGTALGVIRAAHEAGHALEVLVDETRPFLQGARLTAWELQGLGIPARLITDSMAGHFMYRGGVDAVIVGADRIASNGDVANKIGTYSLAVLAREHGIPFYVAAPVSTIDSSIASGGDIPIEERDAREVVEFRGQTIAPAGFPAAHPAFDVTPARLVSAIITEVGVLRAPYADAIRWALAASTTSQPPEEAAVP
jgi:methylthioribose-1-phosphate isomerase